MTQTIAEFVATCPTDLLEVFRSVPVKNFLKQHRNTCFQLIGMHDGAMSEDCKDRFRKSYAAIDEFVKAIEAGHFPHKE